MGGLPRSTGSLDAYFKGAQESMNEYITRTTEERREEVHAAMPRLDISDVAKAMQIHQESIWGGSILLDRGSAEREAKWALKDERLVKLDCNRINAAKGAANMRQYEDCWYFSEMLGITLYDYNAGPEKDGADNYLVVNQKDMNCGLAKPKTDADVRPVDDAADRLGTLPPSGRHYFVFDCMRRSFFSASSLTTTFETAQGPFQRLEELVQVQGHLPAERSLVGPVAVHWSPPPGWQWTVVARRRERLNQAATQVYRNMTVYPETGDEADEIVGKVWCYSSEHGGIRFSLTDAELANLLALTVTAQREAHQVRSDALEGVKFRDTCLVDALRSIGFDVKYRRHGPMWVMEVRLMMQLIPFHEAVDLSLWPSPFDASISKRKLEQWYFYVRHELLHYLGRFLFLPGFTISPRTKMTGKHRIDKLSDMPAQTFVQARTEVLGCLLVCLSAPLFQSPEEYQETLLSGTRETSPTP
ncbi:hypothetical protein AK812_SmicGene32747 [Symbiodinium microadriaticum]|uniref:Uncharacterized protein n=1 Tax=Symbiodinium microadriaticum TaxID=2951 RepID=A0A1Q9CTB9_SYMMI|nr:hypothetical protein AK812_SmicGene32747 [Symbiodinium microadriaticum]